MRTGVTPEGRTLRKQNMPWDAVGQLGDDELRALHAYLKRGVKQTASAR